MTAAVIWSLCSVLVLLWGPRSMVVVQAFETGSELGTIVVYGSALDPTGIRLFSLGADTKATTPSCYLSVDRGVGMHRQVFMPSSLCLDMVLDAAPSGGNSGHAHGVLTTMEADQEQGYLYEMNYDNYDMTLVQPPLLTLPQGYFPALLVPDPDNQEFVYVALHPTHGFHNNLNPSNLLQSTKEYLAHFSHPRYTGLTGPQAQTYSPMILKFNRRTKTTEWQLVLDTTGGKSLVTGMGLVPSNQGRELVVFGSTTGNGMTVGAGALSNGLVWNGYMTWVNAQQGTVDLTDYDSETHNNIGTIIRSQRNKDDVVLGVCLQGDKAYVVGTTTGQFELDPTNTESGGFSGFVLKIDTHGRDPAWKRQFRVGGGGGVLELTHCVVHEDAVLVGGTIQGPLTVTRQPLLAERNGNSAYTTTPTRDILVLKLDTGSGATQFIRQIDSQRHDQLVNMELRPPVGTAPTSNGDVFLTANAWDQLDEATHNDLYVLTITQAGDHDWMNMDSDVDPITGLKFSADQENDNVPPVLESDAPVAGTDNESSSGPDTPGIVVVAVLVPVVALLLLIFFCRSFRGKMGGNGTSKAAVEGTKDDDDEIPIDEFNDVESLASENKIQ